jgi:hypothetical protein
LKSYRFLFVNNDTNQVIAMMAAAIEVTTGAEKRMLRTTSVMEMSEMMKAKNCPLPLYFTEALTNLLP